MGFHGAAGGTAQALQHIISRRWINAAVGPIIGGGDVTGRGDLKYGFSEGAGVVPTAYGALEVEWAAGQTSLVTTPSVARTDTIYVDALGQVNVAQGVAPPPNTCVLDKMRLTAGATTTTGATRQWNKVYALPYGSQLGWLSMWIETYQQGQAAIQQKIIWGGDRTFYVPTDRNVSLHMTQCIYGSGTANGGMAFGTFRYGLHLDGVLIRVFEMGFDRRQAVGQMIINLDNIPKGQHTIKLDREYVWPGPPGVVPFHFGSANNIWQPGSIGIHDEGVHE